MARPGPRAIAPEQRFWPKVNASGPCWEWTASLRNGYGQFNAGDGRMVYAHRFAYETLVGPIPKGIQVDHLCQNRKCVNPDHLDLVTNRENTLRAKTGERNRRRIQRQKYCKAGHRLPPPPESGKRRRCRPCAAERQRRHRQRMKEAR